jgi:hypothetical protein
MPTPATCSGSLQLSSSAGPALYGPSLITVTRLLDNLNNRLLTSDETTTWANLIRSVSAAICRYCRSELLFSPGVPAFSLKGWNIPAQGDALGHYAPRSQAL